MIRILTLLFVFSCGYEQPEESTKTETLVSTTETPDEETKTVQETIAPQWALEDISYEKYYCQDDFYDYLGADRIYDFCNCLIEKVALRWAREHWLRWNYSLKKRLADSGTMRRCAVPTDYLSNPETEEEIAADQQFDPETDPNDSTGLGEAIENAVETGDNTND